jgi:hypothetical protein
MPKKKIPAQSAPSESLLRRVLTWRSGSVPVLALLALTTAFLYWRALHCGVISDGWVVLAIGAQGPLEAMQVRLSYHIIPVTFLFTSMLWKLFGLWEPGYQIANLAQLGLSAWMLYLLGIRLFGRVRIALLAALLLVANASFYEVTFWPVIGNFQILAGFLQIGGVLAALRAAGSPRRAGRWGWSTLFAVLALAAFFTYEPAVSLLAAGPLAAALLSPGGGGFSWLPWRDWRDRVRRALPVLTASVLAFLPMVTAKILAEKSGETAMFFPESLDAVRIRIQFLTRACIAMFTLRGNQPAVADVFHLGLGPRAYGSPEYHMVLGFWAVLFAALTLLAVFRVRQQAVIFLTLWFWIHVTALSTATIMESRQYYLAALPAMLLLAWGISRAADAASDAITARAQSWAGGPTAGGAPRAAAISASAAFLAFALLAAGAKSDIDTAAAVFRDATLDARRVVEIARKRIDAGAAPQSIALFDMPGHQVRQGFSIYPFINGLHEMLLLTLADAVPRNNIHIYSSQPQERSGQFASATRPASLLELNRLVDDPSWLVVRYDEATGTVSELNRAAWKVPREYTAETVPLLPWREGSWPWLRQLAGEPLEMPLALPSPEAWGAVKFLRPNTPLRFDLVEEGATRLQVRSPQVQTPYWPVLAFPIEDDDGETVLTLRPETEVWIAGLWTFAPPARYTPESAPFLGWLPGSEPSFAVYEATRLPVEAEDCPSDPCRIRIGYVAAPGRELAVSVEGGERRELAPLPGEAPGWRTVVLAVPSAGEGRDDTAVVRIEPRGALPALLNLIEIEGTEVDAPAAKPIG